MPIATVPIAIVVHAVVVANSECLIIRMDHCEMMIVMRRQVSSDVQVLMVMRVQVQVGVRVRMRMVVIEVVEAEP